MHKLYGSVASNNSYLNKRETKQKTERPYVYDIVEIGLLAAC